MKALFLFFLAVGLALLSSGGNVGVVGDYGNCPNSGTTIVYFPNYTSSGLMSGSNPVIEYNQYVLQYEACIAAAKKSTSVTWKELKVSTTDVPSLIRNLTKESFVGFACNTYAALEDALFSLGRVSSTNNILDVFPVTGKENYQNFNIQYSYPIIYGGASTVLQTVALMKYVIITTRCIRVGIFDVTADNIGTSNYPAAHEVISQVNALYEFINIFYFSPEASLHELVNVSLQVAIVFSPGKFQSSGLISSIISTGPNYNLGSLWFGVLAHDYAMLQDQINDGLYAMADASNSRIIVFIATNHYLAHQTQYDYIKEFNSEYATYKLGSLSSSDPNEQLYAVSGWLQGTLAAMIFNNSAIPQCTTGEPYIEYYLNEYVSSDENILVNGVTWKAVEKGNSTMGGGYNMDIFDYHIGGLTVAPKDSDSISCRLGGRHTLIYYNSPSSSSKKLGELYYTSTYNATMDNNCYYDPASFPQYLTVSFLIEWDSDSGMQAVSNLYILETVGAMPPFPKTKATNSPQYLSPQIVRMQGGSLYASFVKTTGSLVVMGNVYPGFDKGGRVLLGLASTGGEQIPDFPGISLSITPTLTQCIYDMYGLLLTNGKNPSGTGSVGPSEVYRARFLNPVRLFYGSLSDDQVSLFTELGAKAAAYWNQDAPEVYPLSDLATKISSNGVNFVQGGIGNESNITTILENNPEAYIFLSWVDFIQMYPILMDNAFANSSTFGARILTSSNLPLWSSQDSDVLNKYPILREFQNSATLSQMTPAFFSVYVNLRFLEAVMLERGEVSSMSGLLDTIYGVSTFDLKGIVVQFSNETCPEDATGSVPCYSPKNWGSIGNHLINLNQGNNFSAPIQYPPLVLISETTTTPELLSPVASELTVPVPPLSNLGGAGLAVGIVFFVLSFLLLIGVLIMVLMRRAWRKSRAQRVLSLLDLSVPVTTVTFSFGSIVNPVLEREGASGALRTLKHVEAVIQREMKEYGLIEIENYGSTIVGVCSNPQSVLQCCQKVKYGVKAMGTGLPNVTALVEPGVDGKGRSKQDNGNYNEIGNGMNESQCSEDNAFEDMDVTSKKKKLHAVERKEGLGMRCMNVYMKHPINEGVRGEDSGYINVGSPQVSMGMATGLLQRIEEEGATKMICGMGLSLSRLFAEQLSCGETLLPNSTWYSLSEPESLLVLCGGFFQYFLPCLATASRSPLDDELILYRAGEVDALKKRGQPMLYDLNREVSLGMALSLVLVRVEEKERIPFLIRLIEFQGAAVPSRPANANDLMYIATLLDELEACSPSRNEVVGDQ